jgi:hypothetical protein
MANEITIDLDKFFEKYSYVNGINEIKHWMKQCEIKPEPKIIDLTSLVGSDIDMEFAGREAKDWYVYKLTKIDKGGYYSEKNDKYGHSCRIRENHWHSWDGNKCPLPDGLEVKLRIMVPDRRISHYITTDYINDDWNHVIGIRIIGKKPDYIYEWEQNNT